MKKIAPEGFKKQQGKGRPVGSANKTTTALKEAILKAAENAGNRINQKGLVGYLEDLALTEKSAFSSLLGKVLPLTLAGNDGGPIQSRVVVEFVSPKNDGADTGSI